MPIEEHPFHLYEQSLEIFPESISSDSFVIYHGTSILNSARIEEDGFQIGVAPFDIADGLELVELLRRPEFLPYDIPKGFLRNTTAADLEHYIQYIQSGKAKLSFSSLSFAAVNFASGELKGGQALHYIGEARLILHEAIFKNVALRGLVPESVVRIINYYETVQNNLGVVYAIRIPESLDNFQLVNNVIFTSLPISTDLIIAKVIVREATNISIRIVNNKLNSKLNKPTPPLGLQIIFERKLNSEND